MQSRKSVEDIQDVERPRITTASGATQSPLPLRTLPSVQLRHPYIALLS